jgi:hypothetical protein
MPNRIDDQARAIVRTQALIAQLQASIAPTSAGGKAITGTEAQQFIGQAKQLPQEALKDLKSAILERLTAQDHWECTADARSAFASFLGVPPDKLPAAVDLRPGMSAMSRKIKNEELPSNISKKEMAEILKGTEGLPDELRRQITASLLGMQKEGKIKLDPESRKQFTRAVVETYGDEGPDAYLAYRANSSLQTNNSGNYLAEVLASGGSFEEIIFAFLLMMADKAEKKAIEKMEELARIEEGNRDGVPGRTHHDDGPARPGHTDGPGKPGKPDKPGTPAATGDTKQVARTLEAMVQSAHWATDARSDGGAQVTGKEVARLVGYLDRLPENVQKLLAGSFENALKVGIPITGEAHGAIKGWCEKQLGRPLDLSAAPKPGESNWQDSAVCRRLQGSELLEDRIALFVVNTLYQPNKQLKEKMAPFKALRDGLSSWAQAQQTSGASSMPTNIGAELDAAKKAKDGGAQLPSIPQAVKDAAAAVAPGAPAKKQSPAAATVQAPEKPDLAGATAPIASGAKPAKSGKATGAQPGHEPLRDPKLNQDILNEVKPAAKPEARLEATPTEAVPDIVAQKANDETSQFFDHDPKHVGPAGKSDVRAQNELQIAINERQRVFEMLSNMMKAIHEMQMTSIRNLR